MAVGIMLMNFARVWLIECDSEYLYIFISSGFALAIIKYCLVFKKMADSNIKRISNMRDREPLYRLYNAPTYILIVVMMSAGILARKTGIPREYMGAIDIAIGLGLFLGAIHFFRQRLKIRKQAG